MNADPDFDALYRAEFDQVRRAVYLMCGDAQLAEDATQEAFARALARWRRLRTHPLPGGWITTTAMNVARRQLRRRHGTVAVESSTETDSADAVAVRAAIAVLPPRQQEAVALHYLLDMPVADVARAMQVDAGTVKTHLSRARESLARALTGIEPDPTEEYTP